MARWNDDEQRGGGEHVWLSLKLENTFDFQNRILVPKNTTVTTNVLCRCGLCLNTCAFICSFGKKDCFYHYQRFSFRVTPGSLISKLGVRELFVLIRIKELFSERKL